jgi:excisionase family DNA binding protein
MAYSTASGPDHWADQPGSTRASARAFSIAEFCRVYGIGQTYTYHEIAAGRLRAVKAGRRTLVTREAADEWLAKLPSVQAPRPTASPSQSTKMIDWRRGLQSDGRGEPRANLFNVLHALRNAPEWTDTLAYDDFAVRVVTKRPPPWGGSNVEKWTDDHDTRACAWFQSRGINAAVGVIGRGIQAVARENPFHPVRDYLNRTTWDGKSRINNWLTTYFGADDTLYTRAIGPRCLIAAVARVFEPGCQADNVPIFEGLQGLGKSSGIRELAQPWFTDCISKFGTKDSAVEVAGVWIMEISELDALTRATNSAIKGFVSRRVDRYRPPYGKYLTDQPRQCVLWGTINPAGGYLIDPTGARRFWPVACNSVDLFALIRDRDQLWAEAFVRYQAGQPWHLETPELEALAAAEQAARYTLNVWEDRVCVWLAAKYDVSVGEVLVGALGIQEAGSSRTARNRIADILGANGFKKYRVGKRRTRRYHRERLDHRSKRTSQRS